MTTTPDPSPQTWEDALHPGGPFPDFLLPVIAARARGHVATVLADPAFRERITEACWLGAGYETSRTEVNEAVDAVLAVVAGALAGGGS